MGNTAHKVPSISNPWLEIDTKVTEIKLNQNTRIDDISKTFNDNVDVRWLTLNLIRYGHYRIKVKF